jgi:hypothetical protein
MMIDVAPVEDADWDVTAGRGLPRGLGVDQVCLPGTCFPYKTRVSRYLNGELIDTSP